MRVALVFIVSFILVLVLTACGAGEREGSRLFIATWTLRAPTGESTVSVPSHFHDRLPNSNTTYTLHADVELPPALRDTELAFVIPYFAGRSTLRVDGEEAVRLSDDMVLGYRARGPQSFRIAKARTASGRLALDLEVHHTWSQSAWLDTVPRLMRDGDRDVQTLAVRAVNDVAGALAFAALVQIGITYLAIFLVGRRRRAYLAFAIQALTASYLHLFYLGFTQAVFGPYDVAVLATMISSATIASIYFTHSQFGLGPPSRVWPVLLAISVVIAIAGAGPFYATRFAGKVTVALLVAVIVYQLVVLTKLTRRSPRPLGAETVLASWVVLAILSVSDGSSWVGLGEMLGGMHGECFGLAAFAFLQSTTLGREHMTSLDRSDQLNATLLERVAQLEAGQRENELLEEELRRQITDRSRQLFAALALIGEPGRDAPELATGAIVQERYRIVRPIGQGGMGLVYEVVRLSDERRLALKVTRELDATALARLAREAEIASHIAHPNVVGILDVDVDPSGFLYLVLEYVDGPTLRVLKSRFADGAWAMSVLAQIADGLHALHSHGIVHRDLKPSNVMIADANAAVPVVKITDFGVSRLVVDPATSGERAIATEEIARLSRPPGSLPPASLPPASVPTVEQRLLTQTVPMKPARAAAVRRPQEDVETVQLPSAPVGRDDVTKTASRPNTTPRSKPSSGAGSPLTEVGMLVGTPGYMAPELALGPQIAPSADMFSFGIMAFELLTGTHAFRVPPAIERLEGRSVPPPASIGAYRPELDPAVVAMIDACLSFDPTARPTAEALAREIRAKTGAAA
jgi:serine/threonine protein kinase